MENKYSAYKKEVNNQQLFFVKKFTAFPELENVEPVLETLGMHRDFYRACEMAHIFDEKIINDLYNQLHVIPDIENVTEPAKSKSFISSVIKNTHHVLARFKIAGL
ncbi:MAG: hypothetical protein ABI266_07950 [Ginsengibacter sp.]